ncbi:TPA: permease, partial [bacterium]|nr:permease [bacterium]
MERENRFYVGLKKFLLIVGILILLYLLNTWQWGELKDISLILKNAKLQLFSIIFLAILLEAIPFLLLGTLVSGTIEVLVPQKRLERFIPANRFLAPLSGLFLGLVFPVCSCGSVPVARRLIKKNLPLSGALSYMLAAPIINPIVIFSTA